MKYKTSVGEQEFDIQIDHEGEVSVNGRRVPVDSRWLEGNAILSLLIEHDSYEALVEERGDGYNVLLRGRMFDVRVEDEPAQYLKHIGRGFAAPPGEITVKSPMPGLVVTVPIGVGQTVRKGDVLIILESMKMENELRSPRDGTVMAVRVQPRQSVEYNQTLLVLA